MTLVTDSPKYGIGFLVKLKGCANGGCTANSTAFFKIQDDAGTEVLNEKCSKFDSFRDNSDDGSNNEDFFFIGFQMDAGNRGQSR